ncbi:MAG: hypothetical protein ACI9UN_004406 [Granulosicoccus sp.]
MIVDGSSEFVCLSSWAAGFGDCARNGIEEFEQARRICVCEYFETCLPLRLAAHQVILSPLNSVQKITEKQR